jgi:hypothetical protein
MWPFRRSARKIDLTEYENVVLRPLEDGTMEGIAEYLQVRLGRIRYLAATRRTATATDIAVVDEEMDRICREMAADIESYQVGTPEIPVLSERLQRMVRLTLEEMGEMRDRARQHVDG